jgi:hypothetical protein
MRSSPFTCCVQNSRRGVAMLLVIVSVMMVTVLTTAYLASRDNSGAIAENVTESTTARWAADSGLAMSVAALETEKNWRLHAGSNAGRLFNFPDLGGAQLNVKVRDVLTDSNPTAESEHLRIDVTADVNGVKQSTSAIAYVPLEPGTIADVDLSEFAAFVNSNLTMGDQSMITRWPSSPLSSLGKRVAVGTRSTSASSIIVARTAAPCDMTVYHPPGASNGLVTNSSLQPIATVQLPDVVPLPAPAPSGKTYSALTLTDDVLAGGTQTVVANVRVRNLSLSANAIKTISGAVECVADGDCTIATGAKLIIDGSVRMIIFGNLMIDGGAIELTPSSRLTMYVRGSGSGSAVTIRDGYIGDLRAHSRRDYSGYESWFDTQRIGIFSAPPAAGATDWRIDRITVIKGTLYAPHASQVRLDDNTAIYGRVVASVLDMRGSSAIFYDPVLDSRCGFTNLDSAIYDEDGTMLNALKTVTSLDAAVLQAAADSTTVRIEADAGTKTEIEPTGVAEKTPPDVPPGDPTPRPVKVEYDIISFGADVKNWE